MRTSYKKDAFIQQFSTNTQGCTGECYCGVLHYDAANFWDEDYQENQLPMARKSAESSPEDFQFQDNAIEYFEFNGRLYVAGCKCGMDKFVFGLFNEQKEEILAYFIDTKDKLTPEEAR